MRALLAALLLATPALAQPTARAFDVRAYGAAGDGKTIDSDAINRAIDAAAAAGGGTVYLGAGTYASYSVRLRSNVALYLDQGATLLAADTANGRGYDPAEPGAGNAYQDFGHSHWHNSLIWGDSVENVSITGPGRIDGRGLLRGLEVDAQGRIADLNRAIPLMANKAIALRLARNVTLRDVSNAPFFLRLGSRMRGPAGAPVGALRRVTISNVVVSGADPRYASIVAGIPGHPVEDVVFRDVRILYRGGLSLDHAARQPAELVNNFFRPPGGNPPREPYAVPEREGMYPEPSMFGVLPAYGFWVRHAAGIRLDGVEVGFMQEDTRPAFVLDDVRGADVHGARAQSAGGAPRFVLHVGHVRRAGDAALVLTLSVVLSAAKDPGCG